MRKPVGVAGVVVLAGVVALAMVVLSRGESARLVPQKDTGRDVQAHWEAELARGVAESPDMRSVNLPRQEFTKRLGEAAERYHFDVQRVEFLEPKQLAPMVVVRSADPYALVQDLPAVATALDPKAFTGDDRTGWAWEGFYFEVRDRANKPASVFFNYWRLGGGGQWAAEESLYPFPHG
jgi:hypothetical protein